MRIQSLVQEGLLEGGLAIHTSILAGMIPRTKEPGELQSMGCKESDMAECVHTHLFASPKHLMAMHPITSFTLKLVLFIWAC